ncbi:prolyl 3-hydroxylase OGFOD1 isoform X3 [Echinops telfairi]|uniref:Prolyl 3-hydroxylase OGFOD1 isoform X3 n=1 Tax=Echinops telfairi TaxID=9371 RepID=A0AC55DD42_ECHTE|nr:prolyl 3-hydroxylase OGFOD1 isoform X3 [Echinops telfairi]
MSGKRSAEPDQGRIGKKGKKEMMAELSSAVMEESLKKQVAESWRLRMPLSHEAIVVDGDPFLHCVIPNFIQSQDFLEGLEKELLNLDFHEKCNDLYKFQQSDDLKKRREPHITALRRILYEDFRAWLSDVSNIDLDSTIDMSCAKYQFTDALLCHDDELEGRRIAFILYLVPPWDRSLGGTLDLYSVDEHLQPKQTVKSLVPSWNTLVFFEVSPVSFHQHEILYEWINPTYLDMDYQVQIQEEFEERSEILLKEFLKPENFAQVCEALEKDGVEWSSRGPPNKRFYEKAEESKLPGVLRDCMELFRSEAFFLLLSNFTGLKLHFLAPSADDDDKVADGEEGEVASTADGTEEGASPSSSEPENGPGAIGNTSQQRDGQTDSAADGTDAKNELHVPVCHGELRHWKTGHYTLIHDNSKAEFALDLLLYCGCEGWEPEYGGFTSYIAREEDEELLTVNPENNSLALVYRDRETLKFVKHINHRGLHQKKGFPCRTGFWDFSFVYYE